MRFVFRADGGEKIGTGHIARDLALAEQFRQKGGQVEFVLRDIPGHPGAFIEKQKFPFHLLKGSDTQNQSKGPYFHSHWLETSWQHDAQQTIEVLKSGVPVSCLFVDHYALDFQWQEVVRPHVSGICVIDDLADRKHSCDFLLDQNLYKGMEKRYDGLVPGECQKFLGPHFALLRSEFTQQSFSPSRVKEKPQVLLFMGGVDEDNVTLRFLKGLHALRDRFDFSVDAVVGISNKGRLSIEEFSKKQDWVNLHYSPVSMSQLMGQATFAIGAGGSTNWERFCMGLPSYILAVAQNQIQCSEDLRDLGLVYYGGQAKDHTVETLAEALEGVFKEQPKWPEISQRVSKTVDGLGAQRVAEVIWEGTRV